MSFLLSIVIHTANILGIFSDPFEFAGDYGPEINPIREKVFERVAIKETLKDPTLGMLASPSLLLELSHLQQRLPVFKETDLEKIKEFVDRYASQKVFKFLKNAPPALLSLDKTLVDNACQEGKIFDLPIVSSPQPLIGKDLEQLQNDLMHALYTHKILNLTQSEKDMKRAILQLNPDFLCAFFGNEASTQDLMAFCSPGGQLFFYWLYHSLNLYLISDNLELIEDVNRAKKLFLNTMGNPIARASLFKDKFQQADTAVLFTQECDRWMVEALTHDGRFHLVDRQNSQDGCFIFLRSDLWNSDYQIIPMDDYPGYAQGRINLILAQRINGEKFLLASGHGHSTKAEDGRLQICKIWQVFETLRKEHEGLQLIIGIDANTKKEEDVQLFRRLLDDLGLIGTNVGPTTIKQRMITVQHAKAGRLAIDEEDYLIILKPENGGHYSLENQTVGFREDRPDKNKVIPSIDNPSDHYAVGATLYSCEE